MKIGWLIISAALFAQSGGQPINVLIQNPSFEAAILPESSDQCGLRSSKVPGWVANSAIVVTPTDQSQCTYSAPPDGHSLVELRYWSGTPASISQDLGSVYSLLPHNSSGEVIGVYTLKFFVANVFYWYDGHYSATLSLAQIPTGPPSITTTLCSTSGIAAGDFTEIIMICPSQRAYGELTLTLSSTTPNWGMVDDNVSLTFTPEN